MTSLNTCILQPMFASPHHTHFHFIIKAMQNTVSKYWIPMTGVLCSCFLSICTPGPKRTLKRRPAQQLLTTFPRSSFLGSPSSCQGSFCVVLSGKVFQCPPWAPHHLRSDIDLLKSNLEMWTLSGAEWISKIESTRLRWFHWWTLMNI